MDKVKSKSLRKILFQYSILLIVFMIFCFIVSVQLDALFRDYNFYQFKDDSSVGIIFLLLVIIMVIFLNGHYSHKLCAEVNSLTKQIGMLQEKLDITLGHSKITEIEETLRALDKLKTELSISLQEQWRMEEHKTECIMALGHDMKTPIAILKGNSELLSETELNETQDIYIRSNLYNINRMEQYVEALISAFKTNNQGTMIKETQSFDAFIETLVQNYHLLSKQYTCNFEVELSQCGLYPFDPMSLERAIHNVVLNALEYNESGGLVKMTVYKKDVIHVIIEDSGKGFEEEILKHGTEAFVRGDKSRTAIENKLHLGLGLYQTKKILKEHEGEVLLSKSETLGGAKVELVLK